MRRSTIRALIFDFDGLILETESPIFQSWQELYRSQGFELTLEQWASIIGSQEAGFDPLRHLETLLGERLDGDERLARRLRRETELVAEQQVLPGVVETLNRARELRLRLGVASSSSRRWVLGHLDRLGLTSYFDAIRTQDDVARTKPDPALFLAVLDAFQIQPEQGVVFEDSPNGILAAKRAGLYCVAVPNPLTRGLALHLADLQVASLADLPLDGLLEHIAASRNGGSPHALGS